MREDDHHHGTENKRQKDSIYGAVDCDEFRVELNPVFAGLIAVFKDTVSSLVCLFLLFDFL